MKIYDLFYFSCRFFIVIIANLKWLISKDRFDQIENNGNF